MTKGRRPRLLSAEERALWAQVARAVAPLKGRALEPLAGPKAASPTPAEPGQPTKAGERGPAPASRPNPPAVRPLPPLAPFERKVTLALRRGTRSAEARIDLHGLRQDEAHRALLGFVRRSQVAGHRLVLVVTGKGADGAEGPFPERGVLRRVVPHWLRAPDLRPLVLGFEEAPIRLGGSGALFVRLRRSRPGPGG